MCPPETTRASTGKFISRLFLLPFFEQDGMDVSFEVIDGDQRFIERESQRLGVSDSDQQGAGQPRPLGHGQGVNGLISLSGVSQCFANHRHNRLQMLARSQLRHHAAIGLVGGDLRKHHVRDDFFSRIHDRCSRLIAGAFNAENVGASHVSSLKEPCGNRRTHVCGTAAAGLYVNPAVSTGLQGRLQYCVMSSGDPSAPPATEPVSSLYDTRLPQLSRWRQMQIPIIAAAVIAVIRGLGPTLRFEKLGHHHYDQSRARGVR